MSALKITLLLFSIGLLSGCGGGGGGDGTGDSTSPGHTDQPPAPSLMLTLQPHQTFRFGWEPTEGTDSYRLLENPDGLSGFTAVVEDIPATTSTYDLPVALHLKASARYILEACNRAGCTSSAEVTPVGSLVESIGYFKAGNPQSQSQFGFSVALSGNGHTLVVGSPLDHSGTTGINGNESDSSAPDSGAVHVFSRDAQGAWQHLAYIKASNTDTEDRFGFSVALSEDGRTLAVGAPAEDSAATGIDGAQDDNSATNSGAVYIFQQASDGSWHQQAYIKASNPDASDQFGSDLTLSADGNTLAVSAPFEGSASSGINGDPLDNSLLYSGAVYVFTRDSSNEWSQEAYIKAPNPDTADFFGVALALSGDGQTLAVGASQEDSSATGIGDNPNDNSATDAGAVYVFTRESAVWQQTAYIKASNTNAGDYFGIDLALSGDGTTLAVSAVEEQSAATQINGDENDNSAPYSGAVYVFARNSGGDWLQEAYIKAINNKQETFFGTALALSSDGNLLAVGARGESSGGPGFSVVPNDLSAVYSGAVYLYERKPSDGWQAMRMIKASNPESRDYFGVRVALSHDGQKLAVGAYGEDGGNGGINGDADDNSRANAGAVYVY